MNYHDQALFSVLCFVHVIFLNNGDLGLFCTLWFYAHLQSRGVMFRILMWCTCVLIY